MPGANDSLLIAADDHFLLLSLLFGIVGVTMWAERYTWVRRMSVPLLVIAVPLVLANTGLIPKRADAYTFVNGNFVLIAIPLLLFKADLKRIFAETGKTMLAFLIATAGTFLGAVAGYLLLPLGNIGAQVAAMTTGGMTGGGMNFVAVAQAVAPEQPELLAMAMGAGTPVALLYFMFLSAMPRMRWFGRWDEACPSASLPASADEPESGDVEEIGGSHIMHLALGLGLSLLIVAVSMRLSAAAGFPRYAILTITLLAVIVANVAPRQMAQLRGDADVGMLFMYVFFAVFGATTDFVEALSKAPVIFVFAVIVIGIHFAVTFGAGRLLRFSPREIVTASNACVLGPPTAAALAAKEGWDDLVTPGLLVGVFGYVIGNFVGVTMYAALT